MKQCAYCGALADDREMVCKNCGADISRPAGQPGAGVPGTGQPVQPGTGQAMPQGPGNPPPPPAQLAPPPPQWTPYLFQRQRPFTWADICTVLGFVSSVMGYFWASVLLLPLGLVASLVGFRGDRTRGLAVAGVVISAVGIIIKLMMILNAATYLPSWVTNGIW